MKHTHVIEADSAEEFKRQVKELYHTFHTNLSPSELRPVLEEMKAAQEEVAATATRVLEEKKRGRKPKPVEATPPIVEELPPPAPVVAPAVPAEEDLFGDSTPPPAPPQVLAKVYTQADCMASLQQVVATHKITRAKEILSQFGCAKLVDLKPDQYAGFVAACAAVGTVQ